jgi:hypothetical protein
MSQEQESPLDLEDFIIKHKELLTAMGVFAALTALFTGLEIKEIGNLLSAVSFTVFLLLTYELLTKPPKTFDNSNRLSLFRALIIILITFMTIYLVVVYTTYAVLLGVFSALFFGTTILAMFARFSARYKKTGKVIGFFAKGALFLMVGFAVLFVIALIAFLILYLLGIPIPTA